MTGRPRRVGGRAAGPRWQRIAGVVVLLGLLLGSTGCWLDVQHLPVGGQIGGPTYSLTAVFTDATRLPADAQVQVDGVLVGRVTGVEARDYRALVHLAVKRAVRLPVGTQARLRMTTPLGEEYVALIRPAHPQTASVLGNGATIPVADTSTAPKVEDVLAALATVLNGAGLDQVHTIVTELNAALTGNEGTARDLLGRLQSVVATLDAHTGDIDRLLTNLDRLGTTLAADRDTIATALQQIAPAAQVLAGDTDAFTTLMQRLSDLGGVTAQVVAATRDDLLATLHTLQRPLAVLAGLHAQLPPTLTYLASFEQLLARAIPGDYLNVNGVLSLAPGAELPSAAPATAPAAPGAAIPPRAAGGTAPTASLADLLRLGLP